MPKKKNGGSAVDLGANHYVLSGGGVEITYDTTSFGGKPLLSYQGRQFAGDEQIDEDDLLLGRLVTVTLEDGADDRPIVRLSLLVPSVVPAAGPTAIATLAVQTTVGRVSTGQHETYSALALEGTAQTVQSLTG